MNDLTMFLYQALAEPIGLLLQADDPEATRQALYRARTVARDPELSNIQIRLVNLPDGNIALTKGQSKQVGATKALASELDR